MQQATAEAAVRALNRSSVVITFSILFVIAISAVFFGFIGYYSRVTLANELRQSRDGASIDLLFMSVDQATRDEAELADLRIARNKREAELNGQLNKLRREAYASPELAAYAEARVKLIGHVVEARSRLTEAYWAKLNPTLFTPTADEFDRQMIALWTAPEFADGTSDQDKETYFKSLTPAVERVVQAYQKYDAVHRQGLYQTELTGQAQLDPVTSQMKAIFARSPHLVTADDRSRFNLDIKEVTEEARQRLAQQRAIIRSFDNLFVAGLRKILEWPTIASTLLVTLATGWLGGLVNFMGAAIRARARGEEPVAPAPDLPSLFRRSFLGITAALGIFLAAGSGLLILTAQNSGAPGGGAIELSPYFVAFLAFISGFLADDAFARLAASGRKLFEVKDDQEVVGAPRDAAEPGAEAGAPDATRQPGAAVPPAGAASAPEAEAPSEPQDSPSRELRAVP